MNLALFSVLYRKMQESGLIEIIPLIRTSAIWGQYPGFFPHPESPQGAQYGDCSGWWLDGPSILCLLI